VPRPSLVSPLPETSPFRVRVRPTFTSIAVKLLFTAIGVAPVPQVLSPLAPSRPPLAE
jgi:hypothetical protein